MSHNNQSGPRFIDMNTQNSHSAQNRLARRLFQLEQRVSELEEYVDEMAATLDMLMAFEASEHTQPVSIYFCTCDEDED